MSDVRDDVERAFDEYGAPVGGALLGAALGARAGRKFYKARVKLDTPNHGEMVFGVKRGVKPDDLVRGWISNESPIGLRLAGKKPGDIVDVNGSRYKIIEIKDNSTLMRALPVAGAAAGTVAGRRADEYRKKR